MQFSMEDYPPPAPLPWKIIIFFPIFFSNKVCVLRNILKSNKIAHDSRPFEGKSRLCMSGMSGEGVS